MRESDYAEFSAMLDAVCSLLSRGAYVPSATNTALWFRALAAHELPDVRRAFDAHVRDPQRGRFVPTPADLIAQIDGAAAADGRPGADEAWAIALRSDDESETVVWTAEIAEAWQVCRPVMGIGDEVGARMAFRDAYVRLVDQARRDRSPVSWSVSLGFDPARRAAAIAAAVRAGRLEQSELPALPGPATLLLPGALDRAPAAVREALAALSARLKAPLDARPSAEAIERERTAALKARAAAKVEARGQGEPT